MAGGATVAALALAGSAAFACLVPKGQITVTTPSGAGQTVKAAATPAHATFCVNPTIAASATALNRVTVAVAPSSCSGSATSQLADGTADVVLQYDSGLPGWTRTGAGAIWTWVANNGCFGSNAPATATLGTFTITNGVASGGFNMPSTANLQSSATDRAGHICVKDSGGADGAFAPIVIT